MIHIYNYNKLYCFNIELDRSTNLVSNIVALLFIKQSRYWCRPVKTRWFTVVTIATADMCLMADKLCYLQYCFLMLHTRIISKSLLINSGNSNESC